MIEQNKAEFEKMNLTVWHNAGFKGAGSTVAILDDTSSPHKFSNVEQPLNDGLNRIGHKTNVCSVEREIIPEGRILAFSWFAGHKDQIVDWLFEHEDELDAVNCSFEGRISVEIFDRLKGLDVPIIVSSGNNGNEDSLNVIAEYPWTISVGAWFESTDRRAAYSNAGEALDIVAYTHIYIPTSDGYSRLLTFSGTSCAAPVVSGIIAIYNGWRRQNGLKKMTRDEAKKFLLENALDKLEEGHDFTSGHGLARLPDNIPEPIEITEPPGGVIVPEPTEYWYRVRLNWDDPTTQIGAFLELENAKELAIQNPGYKVYDATGWVVFKSEIEEPVEEPIQPPEPEYLFRVMLDWNDWSTQIAVFDSLSEAKLFAAKHPGYKVYDETGWVAYENTDEPIVEEPIEPPVVEEPIEPPVYLLRVMLDWDDWSTQIGAFESLANAVALADKNPGYKVYDETGWVVYENTDKPINPPTEEEPIDVPIIEPPEVEPTIPPVVEKPAPEYEVGFLQSIIQSILSFFKSLFNKGK